MRADRLVLDTNILISALLQPSGRTAVFLSTIHAAGCVVLFADETFAELASRVMRPKFDRYIDRETRVRFLADLAGIASWVRIEGRLRACRDPDDDKFLEVAVIGKAACIVTGDADLLVLDPYRRIRILSPRDLLALMAP